MQTRPSPDSLPQHNPRGLSPLLASGALPAIAGEELLLRLDLSQGETHRFTMSVEQQMTMKLGAMASQQPV